MTEVWETEAWMRRFQGLSQVRKQLELEETASVW